jgi:CRP-like cAMP-binding protein
LPVQVNIDLSLKRAQTPLPRLAFSGKGKPHRHTESNGIQSRIEGYMSQFEYSYSRQAEQHAFIRIPKALFTNERLARLSVDAKMLYGLMLDRVRLSRKNDMTDREGKAFIYFTLDEVMQQLHCARAKASKTITELRAAGLIETKRRGLGLPNVIYVNESSSS